MLYEFLVPALKRISPNTSEAISDIKTIMIVNTVVLISLISGAITAAHKLNRK